MYMYRYRVIYRFHLKQLLFCKALVNIWLSAKTFLFISLYMNWFVHLSLVLLEAVSQFNEIDFSYFAVIPVIK